MTQSLSGRVPPAVESAYLAYLGSEIPDALSKWETFRDLAIDAMLDPIEASNLITCGSSLFV
jgi:hypothetical protein